MKWLILLVLFVAVSWAQHSQAPSQERSESAKRDALVIGGGWFEYFTFDAGDTGTPIYTFTVPAGRTATMLVTDCRETGDYFNIFDGATLLGQTTIVPFTGVNVGDDVTTCAAAPDWSKGSFQLGAGAHSISSVTVVTPGSDNGAFLRVDLNPGCSFDGGLFEVFPTTYTGTQAKTACPTGYHLADLNSANWNDATTQAFLCAGANQQVWIRSWNTDTYGTCIVLDTGSSAPGGAVTALGCSNLRHILCQKNS